MFDWHDSRFAEAAEPDPLSSAQPQHAQHAALNDSFQVFNLGRSMHSSTLNPGLVRQSTAPSGLLQSVHSNASDSNLEFSPLSSGPSGANMHRPLDRDLSHSSHANGALQQASSQSREGGPPTRQALNRSGSKLTEQGVCGHSTCEVLSGAVFLQCHLHTLPLENLHHHRSRGPTTN